jgi:glyoxylase-like metal-dependent hydrolase (beta-lactamase superfamily II)
MTNLTWEIGDVRITRIVEFTDSYPLSMILPGANSEILSKHRDWLEPHFLNQDDECVISYHTLVIESQSKTIVVDTCIGEHGMPYDSSFEIPGNFLESLSSAGFPRECIDIVLCTHMHFDHVGWNTMRSGGEWIPTFPNACYLFAKIEYDHWKSAPGDLVSKTVPDTVQPILDAGLAELVETTHRITDEVWLKPTHGHSPGHVSVAVESRGEKALITGDMTHHPVQWAEPDLGLEVDFDAEQAANTRRRVIREHVDSPTLIIGTHYPAPTSGKIVEVNGSVRFKI